MHVCEISALFRWVGKMKKRWSFDKNYRRFSVVIALATETRI